MTDGLKEWKKPEVTDISSEEPGKEKGELTDEQKDHIREDLEQEVYDTEAAAAKRRKQLAVFYGTNVQQIGAVSAYKKRGGKLSLEPKEMLGDNFQQFTANLKQVGYRLKDENVRPGTPEKVHMETEYQHLKELVLSGKGAHISGDHQQPLPGKFDPTSELCRVGICPSFSPGSCITKKICYHSGVS